MRAGQLRHLVTVQRPGGTRDAFGERVTTWTDVLDVYADILPLSATERIAAQQAQSEVTHRVRMRAADELSAIHASWRIVYGSRVFVIDGVVDLNEDGRTLECNCSEGMREE